MPLILCELVTGLNGRFGSNGFGRLQYSEDSHMRGALPASGKVGKGQYIIFALIGMAMLIGIFKPLVIPLNRVGLPATTALVKEWMYYNVTFLSANYVDVGFVRRGLGGTIARLLSPDANTGAFLFHLLSAVALILSFLHMGWRSFKTVSLQNTLFMMLFCVVSPQLFLGWGNDFARTDMAVIACVVFAASALVADRPIVAAMLLFVGAMAHETAIIFGVPLLFAVAIVKTDNGLRGLKYLLPCAIGLIASIIVVALIQGALTPDTDIFIRRMLQHTPRPATQWFEDLRDCAIYMMVGGLRGLKTAMCYNVYYRAYPLMIGFTLFVTVANGVILGVERRWMLFLVAIVGPTIFMDLVANDLGRWVKFGCAATWILSAVLHKRGEISIKGWRLVSSALLLGVLLYMGSSRVHTVNRASESMATMLGYADAPEVADWMTFCDPAWRSFVAGRQEANSLPVAERPTALHSGPSIP